jgi:hypothetical protein
MCSIVRILGRYSSEGSFINLWRAEDRFTQDGLLDTPANRAACWQKYDDAERYRTFRPDMCKQPAKVDRIRIEMDTHSVEDWNEIDFVELYGSRELPDGVIPTNTIGLWYVPDRGFVGRDSLTVVPCAHCSN